MWRRWGTPQNFILISIWHLLMNSEKPEKSEFWENEKNCWKYHHFTRVPKTTIIWNTVPEIQSETVILSYFLPFYPPLTTQKIKLLKNEKQSWRYYHFTHAYHKWKSYDVWFLRYGVWQTEFFLILEHFLHFYHFYPILHMCTKNHD